MRKLSLIGMMLMLPATSMAVLPLIVDTTFEDASLGPIDGQVFGGGAWSTPWYGGTNQCNVIDVEALFPGRGQVAAFQTTDQDADPTTSEFTRLVVDRTVRPPWPPGLEWDYGGWSDAYYPYGFIIYEFDYYCVSNQGDWTNFMANYRKSWDYFEDVPGVGDRILLLNVDPGIPGWEWHYPDPNMKFDVAALPIDAWFTIKIEYLCRQPDPLQQPLNSTYDYYINGVQVADDIKSEHWNDNCIEWNFELLDEFMDVEAAGIGWVMIDKVKWRYRLPEPSVLVLGGFGLVALLLRRRKK